MRAGNGFKFLDAAELAFKRTGFLKAISIDELDRPECSHALTALNLDSVPPREVLDEIQKDPDISDVNVVEL